MPTFILQVITNIWSTHNDPDVWENPLLFNPSRHIDNDDKFIKSKFIIPYGLGPRNCLGESVARMEIFMFFVAVMQKFTAHPNPDKKPHLTVRPGLVASPCDYDLVMKVR